MSHSNPCNTCRHKTHDRLGLNLCSLIDGQLACMRCYRIATIDTYPVVGLGEIACGACGQRQGRLLNNDWREGYLGPGDSTGRISPLPCCPGWEAEDVVVNVAPKVERQRGLFGEDD